MLRHLALGFKLLETLHKPVDPLDPFGRLLFFTFVLLRQFVNPHLSLWYGRPDCYDPRYDRLYSIPNLGLLAACLAKTDIYNDTSFAPVGPRRGVVEMVEGIDWNLNDYPGYQDEFAENQINFLELTQTEGAVFWQQNTTLIANSSLQNVSAQSSLARQLA